jgi:peroxiredoxin
LADYRDHYGEIQSLGATVAGVSADSPQISEALRAQLSLRFPLLCDREHQVIAQWDILNTGERGGIARPAVFVIDPSRIVRFAAVDDVVRRVPATAIVSFLRQPSATPPVRRRVHVPLPSHWVKAIRNDIRR